MSAVEVWRRLCRQATLDGCSRLAETMFTHQRDRGMSYITVGAETLTVMVGRSTGPKQTRQAVKPSLMYIPGDTASHEHHVPTIAALIRIEHIMPSQWCQGIVRRSTAEPYGA